MKKRILAGLLTFVLLVTLLPVPALASETLSGGMLDVQFGRGMVLDCQRSVTANTDGSGYEITSGSFTLPYSAVTNEPADLGTDYLKLEKVGIKSDMDEDTRTALDDLILNAEDTAPVFKLVRYTKDGTPVGDFSNVGFITYCDEGICLLITIRGGTATNSYGYFLQAKIQYGTDLQNEYSGTTNKTFTESLADMQAFSTLKQISVTTESGEAISLYVNAGDTIGSIKEQLTAKEALPCEIKLFSGGQELADDATVDQFIGSEDGITAVFSPCTISTPEELEQFRMAVNSGDTFEGKTVKLMADIEVDWDVLKEDGTLNGNDTDFIEWTPIGNYNKPFNGAFDGQGYTISGLCFNDPDTKYAGLFGCIGQRGVIQNVGVADSYICGKESVGGVCGESYGVILDCWNSGTVIGQNQYAGGVCGFNMGTIGLCRNTGVVSGGTRVGGVCGTSGNTAGRIENCLNTGKVSGTTAVGGVCGYIEAGVLTNSWSAGQVSGSSAIGDVCGNKVGGSIQNCYYDSDICSTGDANTGVAGKTSAEFASGEVAHLLQGAQIPQVWGQTLGTDGTPVLLPLLTEEEKAAKRVYKATFMNGETECSAQYANSGDKVELPNIPAVPDEYVFDKWATAPDADAFTEDTPVTADITLNAYRREKYGQTEDEKAVAATYGTTATQDLSDYMAYADGTPAGGKFTYTITSGNDSGYFTINNDTLTVSDATPADTYSLTVTATEKSPQLSLFAADSIRYGTSPVTLNVTVTVNKANPIVTAPTAKSNLVYTGSAQDLVTAGSATGGELQYSLSSGGGYSTDIPTGTDAKTYSVYYKVVGDSNYNDTEPASVDVTISRNPISSATIDPIADPIYTGSPITPSVTVQDGLKPLSLGTDYTVSYSNNVNAGAAAVTVTGIGNYTGTASTQFTIVKADQAAPSVTVDYGDETLSTTTEMEWSADGNTWTGCDADMAAASFGWDGSAEKVVQFHLAGDNNHNVGAAQSVTIPTRPAAPDGIAAEDETSAKNDGKITGLIGGTAYQISSDNGANWTDAALTGTEIAGLAPGDYQVRRKATTSAFASEGASVTVKAYQAPTPPTPPTPSTPPKPTTPPTPPTPPAWENPYSDVNETDWFYESVRYVCENSLFYGTSDTTFSPKGNMTRGMLVAVLYRLAKEPKITAEELFNDVADGEYYSEAIAWAAENQIIAGYGNDRFGPENPITREQLAAILWRYAGSPENTGKLDRFTDGSKASEYAVPALQWAVERGIVSGKGNGVLDPRGKATRAEVASMLMRYCGIKN